MHSTTVGIVSASREECILEKTVDLGCVIEIDSHITDAESYRVFTLEDSQNVSLLDTIPQNRSKFQKSLLQGRRQGGSGGAWPPNRYAWPPQSTSLLF